VDTALCLGACTIGPNVEVDGACWHAMTPEGLRRIVRALGGVRAAAAAPS
jgi:NADH:ubiquinone oxidoreductase subunit E